MSDVFPATTDDERDPREDQNVEYVVISTQIDMQLAGYEAGGWNAMLAPANTPRDVVLKINQAVHAALATPRTQDLLAKSGTEPVTGTPEEFGSFLKSEVVKWGKVVKAAGLVLQ